jgi:hypothetical protein
MAFAYRLSEDPSVRDLRWERYRRSLGIAIPAALLLALLFRALIVPTPPSAPESRTLVILPQAPWEPEAIRLSLPSEPPAVGETSRVGEPPAPAARLPAQSRLESSVAARVISREVPPQRTIPLTALRALRAAVLPLVVTPSGIARRAPVADSRRLAIMRAESLLSARLASLPGTERRTQGPIGLGEGGVTIAIPWGGFLPADRTDEGWRADRCKERGHGKADKPGEGEARRSQCD